jgi:hypothetical protein
MSRRPFRNALASRLGRAFGYAGLALGTFLATPSLVHATVGRTDALPRPTERLADPVWLPHCAMNVVEWRPSTALPDETLPGPTAFAVIDGTCRDAFARFGEFLRVERLPQPRERPNLLPEMSLLPGNVLLDGKAGRALNDLPTRFEAVAPACCYWGLYVDSVNHLFIRNDPLIRDEQGKLVPNPRFVRTLTHEISHILSSRLGVWEAVGYDRQRDEDLAERFVAFMGMRFPAESSAEDLAFHRGTAPFAPPEPTIVAAGGARVPRRSWPARSTSPSVSANTSPQR